MQFTYVIDNAKKVTGELLREIDSRPHSPCQTSNVKRPRKQKNRIANKIYCQLESYSPAR